MERRRVYPLFSPVLSSPIRTLTVGSGFAPDLLDPAGLQQALAGFLGIVEITAGGEFHPALRIVCVKYQALF
jgi:hypothetical protein